MRLELDGQPQRLTVTSIKYGLGIELHDPTNGTETPAWRQVRIDDPVDGNTISVPVRAEERL